MIPFQFFVGRAASATATVGTNVEKGGASSRPPRALRRRPRQRPHAILPPIYDPMRDPLVLAAIAILAAEDDHEG